MSDDDGTRMEEGSPKTSPSLRRVVARESARISAEFARLKQEIKRLEAELDDIIAILDT